MAIPRHIERNLRRIDPSRPIRKESKVSILTPIEVGLLVSLVGIGIITILPMLFPGLVCH